MEFDKIDSSTVSVDATARWIRGGVRYRYPLKEVLNSSVLIGTVGYQQYRYRFDQEDGIFFVDYILQGPFVGFEGIFPVSDPFGLGVILEYSPLFRYRESGADSGTDSKAMAYKIKVGGYYRVWEKISLSLWYIYEKYKADFSGAGTGECKK